MTAMKSLLFSAILVAVVVGGGFALGVFGEAAEVAQEEFGPRAALEKYEWFKQQTANIQKMDGDIEIFRSRFENVETNYRQMYGEVPSAWPLDIRTTYNRERGIARDDLVAVISQRNGIVREYNAASSMFNWALFEGNGDKPPTEYKELDLP